MKGEPFRKGFVHVVNGMCATCIFRPGNLMHLSPGRRDKMVAEAERNNTAIVCHETLNGEKAVCGGFYQRHATSVLQVAARLDYIQFVPCGGFK